MLVKPIYCVDTDGHELMTFVALEKATDVVHSVWTLFTINLYIINFPNKSVEAEMAAMLLNFIYDNVCCADEIKPIFSLCLPCRIIPLFQNT